MSAFELTKWYADCISERGDAAILYCAKLRVRGFSVHYESVLTKQQGASAQARYRLPRKDGVALENGRVEWRSAAWRAAGEWTEFSPGHQETLYAEGEGRLEWNCVAPRAKGAIRIGDEIHIQGWGYVEHLRLTLAPWRLPIRTLRWGRFVNERDTMVWIDWSGAQERRLVLLNGVAVSAESIREDGVVLQEGRGALELKDSQSLREGRLGETALSILPNVEAMFPDSVLKMREQKWLSDAVLRREGQPDSMGRAIHEVVEWG